VEGCSERRGATYTWPYLRRCRHAPAMPASSGAFALHYLTELREGWFAATDTVPAEASPCSSTRTVLPVVWFVPGYEVFVASIRRFSSPGPGYPTALADAVEAGVARELAAGDEFRDRGPRVALRRCALGSDRGRPGRHDRDRDLSRARRR